MSDLHPSLLAALTGLVSGFLLSVPVGPVNLTIINEGARRGLLWGALIGLGATVMEVIYCALAFTGFASLFDGKVMRAVLELVSFFFILYLGIKFMRSRTIPPVKEVAYGKFNPHSAFAIGLVRVMWNPGVFLFWIVLAAAFKGHDLVEAKFSSIAFCVAGVAVGTSIWFYGLSYAVSCRHKKFTERTLLRMEHISGLCLVVYALGQGVHITWQVIHHKF